jgi:hypothetical protein
VYFSGKILRLYVERTRIRITLDVPESQDPETNVFDLPIEHENYNSLYSLVLASAMNGHEIMVRTPNDNLAVVQSIIVDW